MVAHQTSFKTRRSPLTHIDQEPKKTTCGASGINATYKTHKLPPPPPVPPLAITSAYSTHLRPQQIAHYYQVISHIKRVLVPPMSTRVSAQARHLPVVKVESHATTLPLGREHPQNTFHDVRTRRYHNIATTAENPYGTPAKEHNHSDARQDRGRRTFWQTNT